MTRLKMANAKELEPILKSTKLVNDKRTISEQLIDQIICANEKRYLLYLELAPMPEKPDTQQETAIEYFLKPWISLETLLVRLTQKNNPKARGTFNLNSLKRMKLLRRESLEKIQSLRNLRNDLIHGITVPPTAVLIKMGDDVREILSELSELSSV